MESLNIAELRDDEVLVKLVATGICHTDLLCRDGIMAVERPVVLGHEGAGIVIWAGGAAPSLTIGDHVVISFWSCGVCDSCRDGTPAYCRQFFKGNLSGRRLDETTALTSGEGAVAAHFFGQSSFASHSVANVRNVVKVRQDAPLELLGPLGCGVQTGAGAVMNVLRPTPGQSIGIFGAGGVGLSAVMAAAIERCSPIIVIEPHAQRRALALELGATHVVEPSDDVVGGLAAIAPNGLDHAFDTSGDARVIDHAIASLGMRGRVALVAANSMDGAIPSSISSLIRRGITIHGVAMGSSLPQTFIPQLVDYIMEGRFPIERIVRFYPFEDIQRAMDDQRTGLVIKPVLRMP